MAFRVSLLRWTVRFPPLRQAPLRHQAALISPGRPVCEKKRKLRRYWPPWSSSAACCLRCAVCALVAKLSTTQTDTGAEAGGQRSCCAWRSSESDQQKGAVFMAVPRVRASARASPFVRSAAKPPSRYAGPFLCSCVLSLRRTSSAHGAGCRHGRSPSVSLCFGGQSAPCTPPVTLRFRRRTPSP